MSKLQQSMGDSSEVSDPPFRPSANTVPEKHKKFNDDDLPSQAKIPTVSVTITAQPRKSTSVAIPSRHSTADIDDDANAVDSKELANALASPHPAITEDQSVKEMPVKLVEAQGVPEGAEVAFTIERLENKLQSERQQHKQIVGDMDARLGKKQAILDGLKAELDVLRNSRSHDDYRKEIDLLTTSLEDAKLAHRTCTPHIQNLVKQGQLVTYGKFLTCVQQPALPISTSYCSYTQPVPFFT